MSLDDNKRVVTEFVEVCQNQQNLAAANEIFHPDFVNHFVPEGHPLTLASRPAGGFQAFYGMLLQAFPDATMEINEQLAERDPPRRDLESTANRQPGGVGVHRYLSHPGRQLVEHWTHVDFEALRAQMRPGR